MHGPILDGDVAADQEVSFLVVFLNDEFGPWGS